MQKWLASLAVALAGAAVLVLAVIVLGRAALKQLRNHDRYTLAFTDVACTPPPGASRAEFLSEVQFLAGWPDRLHLLDPRLPKALAEVFARHPWVERVDKVEVAAGAVRVYPAYRRPVLVVARPGTDGPIRAVDRHGVLLPLAALVSGLPLLSGTPAPPAGGAGLPWGDPAVEAAAATAAALGPDQERLHIEKIEVRNGDIWLTWRHSAIHWGRPPGQEGSGEAGTASKLQKLRSLPGRESGTDALDLTKSP